MFEQSCSLCQGTRESEFINQQGEVVHESCPYCVHDYGYAALYPRMTPQESLRLAVAVALRVLERAPSYAKRGAE